MCSMIVFTQRRVQAEDMIKQSIQLPIDPVYFYMPEKRSKPNRCCILIQFTEETYSKLRAVQSECKWKGIKSLHGERYETERQKNIHDLHWIPVHKWCYVSSPVLTVSNQVGRLTQNIFW